MDTVRQVLESAYQLWPRWIKCTVSLSGSISIVDGTTDTDTGTPDKMGGSRSLTLSGSADFLRWQGAPGDPGYHIGGESPRRTGAGLYTYYATVSTLPTIIPAGSTSGWGTHGAHTAGFTIKPAAISHPGGMRTRADGRNVEVFVLLGSGPLWDAWIGEPGTHVTPIGDGAGSRTAVNDPPLPLVIPLGDLMAGELVFEGNSTITDTYFPESGISGTWTQTAQATARLLFSGTV